MLVCFSIIIIYVHLFAIAGRSSKRDNKNSGRVCACVRDNYKRENGVELCCVYNCTKSLEKDESKINKLVHAEGSIFLMFL